MELGAPPVEPGHAVGARRQLGAVVGDEPAAGEERADARPVARVHQVAVPAEQVADAVAVGHGAAVCHPATGRIRVPSAGRGAGASTPDAHAWALANALSARPLRRRSRRRGRGPAQDPLLHRVVLGVGQVAVGAQLGEPGQVVDRRITRRRRRLADVAVELRLLRLRHLGRALGHPAAPHDQVDQRSDQREDHEQDEPARLAPPGQLVVAEDVADQGDEHPDEHEQEEEPQNGPEQLCEAHIGQEHSPSPPCRRGGRRGRSNTRTPPPQGPRFTRDG